MTSLEAIRKEKNEIYTQLLLFIKQNDNNDLSMMYKKKNDLLKTDSSKTIDLQNAMQNSFLIMKKSLLM